VCILVDFVCSIRLIQKMWFNMLVSYGTCLFFLRVFWMLMVVGFDLWRIDYVGSVALKEEHPENCLLWLK
jgi:hypothetical protein